MVCGYRCLWTRACRGTGTKGSATASSAPDPDRRGAAVPNFPVITGQETEHLFDSRSDRLPNLRTADREVQPDRPRPTVVPLGTEHTRVRGICRSGEAEQILRGGWGDERVVTQD